MMRARARWLLALVPVGLGAAVAAIAVTVSRARTLMATTALAPDGFFSSAHATALAEGIERQLDGLTRLAIVLGWGPVVCGAFAIVFIAVDGALARRSIVPSILGVAAVSLPPTLAGTALAAWCLRVRATWAGVAGVAPEDKPSTIARGFADAAADLAHGRALVLVAVAIAAALAVTAAVIAARRGTIVSAAARIAAALLFAAAVAGFVATRALADDGAHPLVPIEGSMLLSGKTIERVPRVERCDAILEQAPVVDAGSGIALNGRSVTPAELRDDLDLLRRNRRLLHPDDASPPTLALLAPATRPAAELAPIFTAARDAGYTSIQAVVIVPRDVDTRTLGRIGRASDCRRLLALDRPFTPAPGQTWADALVHDAL